MTEPYNYQGCKGCAHKSSKCLLYLYHPLKVFQCPCRNCTIKMMCSKMCMPRVMLYLNANSSLKEVIGNDETLSS